MCLCVCAHAVCVWLYVSHKCLCACFFVFRGHVFVHMCMSGWPIGVKVHVQMCVYMHACVCYFEHVCAFSLWSCVCTDADSVQISSVSQPCPTFCNPMGCSMPGFPVHHQLPEFTQTQVHRFGDAIQPPHRLSSPFPPPSVFPSIRVFSSESLLHISWPKYWSFSFSISPSNEYSGLISFRIDWLDLLAVQETLKSLLQHHSSKTSILWCSAFFIVSTLTYIHDYWKNHD